MKQILDNSGAAIDQEARDTEIAMRILQSMVPEVLTLAGPSVQARFDNALLNIAVNRIVEAEGAQRASTILFRLADAVSTGPTPEPGSPVDLTCLNG